MTKAWNVLCLWPKHIEEEAQDLGKVDSSQFYNKVTSPTLILRATKGMLAIGRALMADPKMLILDEPSCGLQLSIVFELFHRLKEIKTKVSLLIAEQNVRQCLKAIDRGYVIENGRIVMEKGAQDLAGNDHIRRFYLGL